MRFWDSSAIVPLLVADTRTRVALSWFREDPSVIVWWSTEIECASALARLEREGSLERDAVTSAFERLDSLKNAWHEVQPVASVRMRAIRLLRVHPLRSADALQLSAALAVAEDNPASLRFVTFDERLAFAASKEGLPV